MAWCVAPIQTALPSALFPMQIILLCTLGRRAPEYPGSDELTPDTAGLNRRNKTKGEPVSVGAGSTGSNFIN
jgi:hypothetical protein